MNNLLSGKLTSRGNLNGNVNTIVYAHNYNDLTNKPSINNVTLQGNKTAFELGLATPSDITVTSVNEQTGDVVLSGSDIDYSVGVSLNAKINDLETQIQGSGVQTVNGMTGNVTLTANDINYSTGVTIKNKIDAVENEIPDIYVSSVNGNSGAVTLTGSDVIYSGEQSVNGAIDSLSEDLSGLTAQSIPMSGTDSTPIATAVGDLSTLTTTDKSSIVGAVNEVVSTKQDKIAANWQNATKNSVLTSGVCQYAVVGNLVFVTVRDIIGSTSTQGQILFSDLPKAKSEVTVLLSPAQSGDNCRVKISGTNMIIHYANLNATQQSQYYANSIIYIKE